MRRAGLSDLWKSREDRVRARLDAVEAARRAVERVYADPSQEGAVREEAALETAKRLLETERLRPSHFRCFRRKPGAPEVVQEVDLACEDDAVGLSLVLLSSEPCLPESHRLLVAGGTEAVSVWPNALGTFEILVECRERRYVSELAKIQALPATDRWDRKWPLAHRKFALVWKGGPVEELFTEHYEEIEETMGAQLNRFKRRKVAHTERAVRLWQLQRVPFDKAVPEHEARLLRLWSLVYPDVTLPGRTGAHWKALGFQGNDPATDFRGMGLLGLELLLFMAERRPDDLHRVLDAKLDYPFACGAINVAALLFQKLKFSNQTDLSRLYHSSPEFESPLMDFFCRVEDEFVFEETFSCLCLLVNARFDVSRASYMQFNGVIQWVSKELDALLQTNVVSVEQLRFLVGQKIQFLYSEINSGANRSPTASQRISRADV